MLSYLTSDIHTDSPFTKQQISWIYWVFPAAWYSQCVVSDRAMVLLSVMNTLSLVRWPKKCVWSGRGGFVTLPTAHFAALKITLFLNCTRGRENVKNDKGDRIHIQGSTREEEKRKSVSPQLSSSRPSEQSFLKSHTLSFATHSPSDWHANIPSGQGCGWRVGACVVTDGVVVFCLGSSPSKFKQVCWLDKKK